MCTWTNMVCMCVVCVCVCVCVNFVSYYFIQNCIYERQGKTCVFICIVQILQHMI